MLNRSVLGVMVVFLLILTACTTERVKGPPTPVTVQLQWSHNAQFAGLYAADQKGFFAAEGLAVTFREGGIGNDNDYVTPVVDGTAQFGVMGADEVISACAAGEPVRTIAVIYRRSPVAFVALADSGIQRPEDFVGQTIRTTSQVIAPFHAMMARVGIRPDQYNEVYLPSDVSVFASGSAAVWALYASNLGVMLEQAGYKLNFIYADDYGVHFYGDTLFTTDRLIAENPDLVQRFTRAVLEGWTYVVAHPAEAGSLVAKYNPSADRNLENAKMVAALPLIDTGYDHIGWMTPSMWVGMEQTLRSEGVLTQTVDLKQVYTMDFLREIYAQ